jgi:hypothetical protein
MACYSSSWWPGCWGISGYSFGAPDPDYGTGGTHPGTDFGLPSGTPLTAGQAGHVTFTGWMPYLGNTVNIVLDDGTKLVFAHLQSITAGVGPIAQGTQFATTGQTGNVSGPHLHMEVRPNGGSAVDPVGWLTGQTASTTKPVSDVTPAALSLNPLDVFKPWVTWWGKPANVWTLGLTAIAAVMVVAGFFVYVRPSTAEEVAAR